MSRRACEWSRLACCLVIKGGNLLLCQRNKAQIREQDEEKRTRTATLAAASRMA